MNKIALREAILEKLRSELEQQTAAAHLARDEAISEESRPENQYDMHSQEAAYLAEGQAKLAAEIAENLTHLAAQPLPAFSSDSAIALGAVVEIGTAKGHATYFLAPRGGGIEIEFAQREIMVITPQSPLGRQLIGKRVGDSVQLPGRSAQKILSVV